MFECVAFSSFPDKTSTVQAHGEFTYREISSDVVTWAIKQNSLCVVEPVVFLLAGLVVSVGRRVINSPSTQEISPGDCDDDEAVDGNVDCCVADGCHIVDLGRK